MAEGARLESVYTVKRIEGSNPSLSASNMAQNGLSPLRIPGRRTVCAAFSFLPPDFATHRPLHLWVLQAAFLETPASDSLSGPIISKGHQAAEGRRRMIVLATLSTPNCAPQCGNRAAITIFVK